MISYIKSYIKKHPYLVYGCFFFTCMMLSLSFGSTKLDLQELLQGGFSSSAWVILQGIRIPRMFAAILCGWSLSIAGMLLQILLKNDLASPSIVGVNAGAGLAVACILLIFPNGSIFIPIAAFLGAMLVTMLILSITHQKSFSTATIILAGVAISGIFNALLSFLKVLVPTLSLNLTTFLIGSFSSITMKQLFWPALLIVLAILILTRKLDILNVMQLGDQMAHHLGVPVRHERFVILLLASLLAGASVTFAGLVGFVGLMVPHLGRRFVGSEAKQLFIFNLFIGPCFVMLCDLGSRLLFRPYELPVGILLSILGGCFFLFLLFTKGENNHVGNG